MTRPPAGSRDTRAFSSLVFPEPVPPEIRTLRSLRSTAAAASTHGEESEPLAVSSSVVKARPPKRRIVIAVVGTAGGLHTATHEPSASRAPMIGSVAGSSPSGRAIWIAARATTSADGVDVLDLRVRHQHLAALDRQPERRGSEAACQVRRVAAPGLPRALRAGGDPALQLRIDADAHDAPAPPPRSAQQVRWFVSCTSLGVIPVWRRSRP